MAEFTELPIAAGPLVPRSIYNELLNAINNRRAVVLPAFTAAFTIYNNSGDATSATVKIDTVANEIYLIVIGGANVSNITKDLTAAAQDTITELVAVINALGKGWVAVEKSGAQHAFNTSQQLLSLGPADCLGATHITWFTNYAPNGVIVGELYGHIAAYRAAIDVLTGYFYTTGTSTITFNTNTLHNAAFGSNDWDAAGAPNLTPPCLPHKYLWNNMKSCLDLLVWIRADSGLQWTNAGVTFASGLSIHALWNTARATAFANMDPGAATSRYVGRWGYSYIDGGDYKARIFGRTILTAFFATVVDFTGHGATPTLVDGQLRINAKSYPPNAGVTYITAQDYDVDISGVQHSGVPISMIADTVEWIQFTPAIIAATDLSGANNAMQIEWMGVMTTDIGAVQWPAPVIVGLPNYDSWSGGYRIHNWTVYLKLSWA